MSEFTSRIIKGGALLEDSRRLVESWRTSASPHENIARVVQTGALGKGSRSRVDDVIDILRRRLVAPGPDVLRTLHLFANDPRAFREACYYEASRSDPLLRAFAAGPLFRWHEEGCRGIGVSQVARWLASDRRIPSWGEETRNRVAQGLLSALRDFGILQGVPRGRRKAFAPVHITMRGFAYVALRERTQHESDRALLQADAWLRYLLPQDAVRRLFLEADRLRVLRFAEAGSAVRIDWLVTELEEVPRVLAA